MTTRRLEKHLSYFSEFEMAALEPVCLRIGRRPEELTRQHIESLLCISYSLPHEFRGDQDRCLSAISLAEGTVSTFSRYEIGLHLADRHFVADARVRVARLKRAVDELWQGLAPKNGGVDRGC